MGLGNASGFEFVVQSLTGASPADLAAVARGLMGAAQQEQKLQSVFTTYSAATPQIYLKLDRERAQALGISISDIFSTLQTAMGGTYANDFNMFGRTWQVKIQAQAEDRKGITDIFRVRLRTAAGDLVPLQAVADVELITAPVLDHPLQQPALRGAERRPGAGLLLRRGDRSHGNPGEEHPARRLRLRMDRHGAAGEGGVRPDRLHPRPRGGLRLSLPGRPLREHDNPGRRATVGLGRPVRRRRRPVHQRPRQQPLCPDRHRRADRAGRQERAS